LIHSILFSFESQAAYLAFIHSRYFVSNRAFYVSSKASNPAASFEASLFVLYSAVAAAFSASVFEAIEASNQFLTATPSVSRS
jgi:hypothetical protein